MRLVLFLLVGILAQARLAVGGIPAGDDRSGYDSLRYVSHSRSLDADTPRAADLTALVRDPPLGLPVFPVSPPTQAAIDLGRRLFFDRRLSANATLSCAMCHIPEQGFTQHELKTPVGIEGRSVRRNAPALYNVVYRRSLFHDGRETQLEAQIWAPLLADNEMGNSTVEAVLARLRSLPGYVEEFRRALHAELTRESLGLALASYQRALLSADSPFDRWYFGKDAGAMTLQAIEGFAVFNRAGCVACHGVGAVAATFSDEEFHDTGTAYLAAQTDTVIRSLQVAPGVVLAVSLDAEPQSADLGRFEVSGDPQDRWRMRTPSLRNIALSAPYMHNGMFADLKTVIDHYNRGGEAHPGQDPRIAPLHLSAGDKVALRAFLESLTGSNADALAADARSAPIGDN